MTVPRPPEETVGNFGRQHLFVLAAAWAACNLLLLLCRSGYPFPPFEVLDSWIYTGYQWSPRSHITEFGPLYYGSRLTLILPGALLHQILPPMAANVAYKLMESALFATGCGLVAYRARGVSTALLAVVLSVLCPQFICALHTDYMDTAVILYGALALGCITMARNSPRWAWWVVLAGVAFGCMCLTNLSTLAMPGLGIAAYHLLWLNWGFRRQLASVGLYAAAGLGVLMVAGLVNLLLGGEFHILKPQIDMILYFHSADQNPWSAANWNWLPSANWLVVPACALLWGLHRSFFAPLGPEDPTRQLTRALTGAMAICLAMAVNLEMRGIGVLVYNFYASFQLCLAVPLLAVCYATSRREGLVSTAWLGAGILALAWLIVRGDSQLAANCVFRLLPGAARPSPEAIPMLAAGSLMVVAALLALTGRCARRPEFLLLGILFWSMPLGFHGPAISDRLPQRYVTVYNAFRALAREFPRSSYRIWMHPKQPDGVSLASAMLYGYRLVTLQLFPDIETANLSPYTIVIPAPPREGAAVLAQATQVLAKSRIMLAAPRIISVAGDRGTGMDLICFTMQERPISDEELIEKAQQGHVFMDWEYAASPPYTQSLVQQIYGSSKRGTITHADGFPLYTPTDRQDHLWAPYQPLANARPGEKRQLTIVAVMPAEGQCVCLLQMEGYREFHRISLTKKGRSVFLVTLPPAATSLRICLLTDSDQPTALPTSFTIYEPNG